MSDSEIAIRVQNLSKRYRIGLEEERHDTFASTVASYIKRPGKNLQRLRRLTRFGDDDSDAADIIWALKDISFEVKRGEVLGIIGRNGAGKSTLLKVLSRITYPTSGRFELRGRVSSLLEVGTGFHPELTGRENTYLNGTILGMRKKEIDRKFDEIVDFSGVEKFIDTPVKRYSSGMRVRLAFSVAAHLEPEILLIDEVLAVGDTEFQKRSVGKMKDIAGSGRTVLFVSHNMAAIQSLCSEAILLQAGQITTRGSAEETIRHYLQASQELISSHDIATRVDRKGDGRFRFLGVDFLDADTNRALNTVISGQNVIIRVKYAVESELNNVVVSIAIRSETGSFMFACRSDVVGRHFHLSPGEGTIYCHIPRWPLNTGRYFFNLLAQRMGITLDWLIEAGFVDTEVGDYYQTGKLPATNYQGVFINFGWAADMSELQDVTN